MTRTVDLSTPSEREIVLARTFDAPRELVFEAWIRPELLTRWYGARGWQLVECDLDPRVGGRYRFVSRGPAGATMVQRGVYRALVVPELIVHTERFDDQSYPGETLITHAFTAGPDGRTTVTSTVCFQSRAARDRVLRYPMASGVAEGYQRLDALLAGNNDPEEKIMNWTLEVVVVPVSDVDRAKDFYSGKLGFQVDHDTRIGDGMRVVQLTPPGSGCSIVIGEGAVPPMPPGSLRGLQLVVSDVRAAREQLLARGVEVGEVQVLGQSPTPQPDPLDNVGFVFFSDPDGNGWGVQQISSRG